MPHSAGRQRSVPSLRYPKRRPGDSRTLNDVVVVRGRWCHVVLTCVVSVSKYLLAANIKEESLHVFEAAVASRGFKLNEAQKKSRAPLLGFY